MNNSYQVFATIASVIKEYSNSTVIDGDTSISDISVSFGQNASRKRRSFDGFQTTTANIIATQLEQQIRNINLEIQTERSRLIQSGLKAIENQLGILENVGRVVRFGTQQLTSQSISEFQRFFTTLSQNASTCFNENPFPYQELINQAFQSALTCVENKYNEALNVTQKSQQNIENAYTGVTDAERSINDCNTRFGGRTGMTILQVAQISCLGKTLLTIRRDTIMLPIEIGKRIAEIRSFFGTIESDIIDCAAVIAEDVTQLAVDASQKLGDCLLTQ